MSSDGEGMFSMMFLGALALAAAIAIGLLVFAFLSFVAVLLTLVAMLALNKPRRIARVVVEPYQARFFVQRGAIGAGLATAFVTFTGVLLGFSINWDYLPYFLLIGYVAGSVGIEIIFAFYGIHIGPVIDCQPASKTRSADQHEAPRAAPKYFEYASWDDEQGSSR